MFFAVLLTLFVSVSFIKFVLNRLFIAIACVSIKLYNIILEIGKVNILFIVAFVYSEEQL